MKWLNLMTVQITLKKLEKMKDNTLKNMEAAEETMNNLDLKESDKKAIEAKNARRQESLGNIYEEIADEERDAKRR